MDLRNGWFILENAVKMDDDCGSPRFKRKIDSIGNADTLSRFLVRDTFVLQPNKREDLN